MTTDESKTREELLGELEALRARVEELERTEVERGRIERDLRRSMEAAESATKAKSEFLANMSHEIRTPMTAILGFAESLLDSGLGEADRNDAVRTILQNGDYLITIINDILDLSKIEAEKLEIESIPCAPLEIASSVKALVEPLTGEKGLRFLYYCVTRIPETIRSDPVRIKQILMNLMGNAIKFTDDGTILFLMGLDTQGAEPRLQFSIMDSGIGMTDLQLKQLFTPFTQADSSTTRKFGGTGLGLVISKKLAKLLGGDLCVYSKPEKGSVFRVRIPVGPLDGVRMLEVPFGSFRTSPPTRSPDSSVRIDARVLVAEDTPVNQKLITMILERAGARVSVCNNGKEAVNLALSEESEGRPFDVILMDMQMPMLDGYEATRLLRLRGYSLPIIAITANAMSSDRDKCIQAGCDDYATKPIKRTALLAQINRLLASSRELEKERE